MENMDQFSGIDGPNYDEGMFGSPHGDYQPNFDFPAEPMELPISSFTSHYSILNCGNSENQSQQAVDPQLDVIDPRIIGDSGQDAKHPSTQANPQGLREDAVDWNLGGIFLDELPQQPVIQSTQPRPQAAVHPPQQRYPTPPGRQVRLHTPPAPSRPARPRVPLPTLPAAPLPSTLPPFPEPTLPTMSHSAPETRVPSPEYPTPHLPATTVPSRVNSPAPLMLQTIQDEEEPETLDRIPKSRDKEIDYSKFYTPIAKTPPPFMTKFEYNRSGEWKGNLHFTNTEIQNYMDSRKRLGLPLRIWIQNSPAGCNKRGGPDSRTRKCRWDRCPGKNNTILKGFWRVAFDERPETSGTTTDPFMNAGYMHLWCFERCFDLIAMISTYDIRPDARVFPREDRRNPMSVVRDHPDMMHAYQEWKSRQIPRWNEWCQRVQLKHAAGQDISNSRRHREPQDYLWSILTEKHLSMETHARQVTRNQRGGNSIDKHRGDLRMYVDQTEARRLKNKANKAKFERWNKHYADHSPPDSPLRRSPRNAAKRKHSLDTDDEDFSPKKRRRSNDTRVRFVETSARPGGSSPSSPLRRSPRLLKRAREEDESENETAPPKSRRRETEDEIVVASDGEEVSPRRSSRIAEKQSSSKPTSPVDDVPHFPSLESFTPSDTLDPETYEGDFNFDEHFN